MIQMNQASKVKRVRRGTPRLMLFSQVGSANGNKYLFASLEQGKQLPRYELPKLKDRCLFPLLSLAGSHTDKVENKNFASAQKP